MINSPVRRAALLAAVVFTLPLPAAAHGDAALSHALGAMYAPLAAMAQLKTQPQIPAATQASGLLAPADVWKKVLDKVRLEGEKGAVDGFFTYTLTGRGGDPKLDNALYSIIVFYFVDANNNFKVVGAELELEQSTLKSGTIRTEYWTMFVRPYGKIDKAIYKERVDVPGADLIPGVSALVDLADPRVEARFDEMLKFWSAR